MKTSIEIKNDLQNSFTELEFLMIDANNENVKENIKSLDHLELNMAEYYMNALQVMLEKIKVSNSLYLIKKNWPSSMINAEKLLTKYSKQLENGKLVINEKYDSSNYISNREFLEDLKWS